MPKAYLKYVQHEVLGALVAGTSNIELCTLLKDGEPVGQYLLSACNEVTNFINLQTKEAHEHYVQVDNKAAEHGFVTRLKASGSLLAVGYSSGTVIIYDLDLANAQPDVDNTEQLCLKQLNKFSFHRSGITFLLFDRSNTELYSGSQDTYIVVYDLVSDRAQFKLMGHREPVTQLAIFDLQNPYLIGKTQRILVSSSSDGFLKFWDLEQQQCILSHSDELMSKISSLLLIPDLNALVVGFGTEEKHLAVFKVFVSEQSYTLDIKAHRLKRQASSRILELAWDDRYLACLSADNKVETWKVNTKDGDWQEAVVKKMARTEKRQGLKRRRHQVDDEEGQGAAEQTEKVKVNKDDIRARVLAGNYDVALHFTHKGLLEADPQQGISSLAWQRSTVQKKKGMFELFLAQPSANQILCYDVDLKKDEE